MRELHLAHIASPKLFAIDSRVSRIKYNQKARAEPVGSEDRQWNREMAAMAKRHQQSWEQIYIEDFVSKGKR